MILIQLPFTMFLLPLDTASRLSGSLTNIEVSEKYPNTLTNNQNIRYYLSHSVTFKSFISFTKQILNRKGDGWSIKGGFGKESDFGKI